MGRGPELSELFADFQGGDIFIKNRLIEIICPFRA